jgi:uncharacterized membrane protein
MLMKLWLGLIMIIAFLLIYPSFISLWTDNISGFNRMIVDQGTSSQLELSIWGLFPFLFLVLGVGGIAWLIVRDKER